MGNENSSISTSPKSNSKSRTLIPLDECSCWQLFNGINDRAEPISYFITKKTYSVECHRSIQFLKTIRHPNIIKFLSGFKTFSDQDSFIADCVHPLSSKLNNNDVNSISKLGLGLFQIAQALEFLHNKTFISHNNITLSSIYISLNGVWKIGNFECASRYDNLNKKYLATLKLIRSEKCITPEEKDQSVIDLNPKKIDAIDVYGFGKLIETLLNSVQIEIESMKHLFDELQTSLTVEHPESRPTWSMLLKTQLFQLDYIKATELLDRLPTIEESDLANAVDSLSTFLDGLTNECFDELLVRRLLSPFMFLCSTTRSKIIPRILVPKQDGNHSWILPDQYRQYATPLIADLFSYHVTFIRETLLQYFVSYWQLLDQTIVVSVILPQLVYGLKDVNDNICSMTLVALASMVPVLGADIVVGGQRKQIFADTLKKECVIFPNRSKKLVTDNSTSLQTSPKSTRESTALPTRSMKITDMHMKSSTLSNTDMTDSTNISLISSLPTNGHQYSASESVLKLTSAISVSNGHSEHQVFENEQKEQIEEEDNDDEPWSDWNQPMDNSDTTINHSELFSSRVRNDPIQQVVSTKSSPFSLKTSKNTSTSKPKWDPNAPLGSEYEIPPVSLKKKNPSAIDVKTVVEEDDFFKDMAPKVQTIELMQQLETMFSTNINQVEQAHKDSSKKTINSLSSVSNKFGISNVDVEDNQEKDIENNWDD